MRWVSDSGIGRRWRATVAVAVVGGVLASAAAAATIVGTSGNDVLRGTAKADRMLGKGGNDRLYGLAGADVLQGGPGVDRYVCGAGRDTVIAAPGESVARDCEVVKRVGPPPLGPSTAPPTEPTVPPPPPPVPPAQLARPGFFGGFANTGGSVNFVVAADGRTFSQFKFGYQADCRPPLRIEGTLTYSGTVPIAADRTFSADGTTADGTVVKFSGSFDEAGVSASGRFQVQTTYDEDGTRYTCDSGGADWSAKSQG